MPFSNLTFTTALEKLRQRTPANYERNQKLLEGDHWQNGAMWSGPHDPAEQRTMDEVERGFTSRNVVEEVASRHTSGTVGIEPFWHWVPRRPLKSGQRPTAEEQALIDEIEAAQTVWWDERGIPEVLQVLCEVLLVHGRADARTYIPAGFIRKVRGKGGERKVVSAATLADAFEMIYVSNPAPTSATVYIDEDTKQRCGILHYERDGKEFIELVYLEGGQTVLRTLGTGVDLTFRVDLGGRLTQFEMDGKRLISESVVQNQKTLNLALSVLPRNLISSGWLERVLTNAKTPGRWETDAHGNDVFIPQAHEVGPGVTTYVEGQEVQEVKDGEVVGSKLATPGVHFREPSSVTPTIEAARAAYQNILEEVSQEHVLIAGDATASGKSRQQARAEFRGSLLRTKSRMERFGRWLLETSAAQAEAIAGMPGRYTKKLRPVFICRLDLGPASPDEQAANTAAAERGFLSREEAMSRNGVEDVDAESAKISQQPENRLALLKSVGEVVRVWTSAGASVEGATRLAARTAGLPEEELRELLRTDYLDNVEQ